MKFDLSAVKLNWFPGHMATSLRQMRSTDIDLILEVRDARIPQSSRNPLLQELSTKPRLILFNKSDLIPKASVHRLQKEGILMSQQRPADYSNLLERISGVFSGSLPFQKHRVMILGIPNVGKSTIINALRAIGTENSGKAVKTGALAGVTRSVSNVIKICEKPPVYLIDTPGITQPRMDDPLVAMKIALCGGLFDKVVGNALLAEYLLFELDKRDNEEYRQFYRLSGHPVNIKEFLNAAAIRIGALREKGEPDLDRAAAFFVRQFRQGKFGPIDLDA